MTIGGEEMLTINQAAERLGLSRKTLWLQVNRDVLHAVQIGIMWVIAASELERYAHENKGKPGRKAAQPKSDA